MLRYIILALPLLLSITILSQTVLYNESFTGQIGKGVSGPSPLIQDTLGVSWFIDTASATLSTPTDFFKVNSNEKFEGTNLDGEIWWYSPVIDISSLNAVNLEVLISETGDLEGTDYIEIYYKLNSNPFTLFHNNGSNTDDFTALTALSDSVFGDSVQIAIKAKNNASTEHHYFDDIFITETISEIQNLYDLTAIDTITLKWANPASDFDEVLIISNANSAISAGTPIGDGSLYSSNFIYGSGSNLLGGNVIYKDTLNQVEINGLIANTTYYFKAFTRKDTTWSKGLEFEVFYNPPSTGDILITEYARDPISEYSYIELYNRTSTDINLSGGKIIVNNVASTSEIVDLSTELNEPVIVPANGFLILNRNRSINLFESKWNVDLTNTGYDVNYIRTGINNFGNNKFFQLKMGGLENTDNGILIDESSIRPGSTDKRIYQLPAGYWTNNIDSNITATPGSFGTYENVDTFLLVYSDNAWHNATGSSFLLPSSLTSSISALILRDNAPIANGSSLNNLAIMPNSSLDLTTENITIHNDLTILNNASLQITDIGSVTCLGNTRVIREGVNSSNDYNIWGAPFSSIPNISSTFPNANPCDILTFQASNQSWKYDFIVGNIMNCSGFNYTMTAQNVIPVPEGSPDGNFDLGRGYFIVGDSINVITFTDSNSGLNNGNISVNIYGSSDTIVTGSNDWNLICNPYPSGLSTNEFLNANNSIITNAVYLYNPNSGQSTSTSFSTYNGTDNFNIASCQGFYVDANSTINGLLGTVTFSNSMRNNQNSNFRSNDTYQGIYLSAKSLLGKRDQTRIYFDVDSKDPWDNKFDAIKMENSVLNFGSLIGPKIAVFNGLSALTDSTKTIPLYFQTSVNDVFSIQLDSLIRIYPNKLIILEDRLLQSYTDLRIEHYTFQSNINTWDNRFFLHIKEKRKLINKPQELNQNKLTITTSTNEITISSTNKNNIDQIVLYTTTGQYLLHKYHQGTSYTLNINNLPSGIYFLQITIANQIQTRKIIIP